MKLPKSYKIDSLKLQQKIYNLHPENSHARKLMVKREQMLELNSLTLAKSILFPDEQIVVIEYSLQTKIWDAALLGICGIFLVVLGTILPRIFPLETPLGLISYYGVLAGLSIWTIFKFKACIERMKEIYKLNRDSLKISDRIKELADKVFKDL